MSLLLLPLLLQAAGPSLDPTSLAREVVHVRSDGQAVVAHGPDYRARFGAGGWVFTPALGEAAPRSVNWSFRLESVGRETAPVPVGSAVPVRSDAEGPGVTYDHGHVLERYDARADGIEQSFLVHRAPAGSGDLVVSGRIDTGAIAEVCGDTLAFRVAGQGGVRIGAVVGIDAHGARVAGHLRFEDGQLELRLPASFVDRAAWPVLVDPLIGTEFPVASGPTTVDADPDTAFEAARGFYVVAWERILAANDVDVHLAVVDPNGGVVTTAVLPTGGPSLWNPAVAAVEPTGRVLVVCQEGDPVLGPSMLRAFSIQLSSAGAFVGGFSSSMLTFNSFDTDPAVGGHLSLASNDRALLTWVRGGTELRAMLVRVSGGGPPQAVFETSLDAGLAIEAPAVSPSVANGGWCVVYSAFPPAYGNWILGVKVVDTGGGVVHSAGIGSTPSDYRNPDVAVDGSTWMVVHEVHYAWGEKDLAVLRLEDLGGSLGLTPASVLGSPGPDDVDPTLVWLGGKFGVYWTRTSPSGDDDVVGTSLSPDGLLTCEPQLVLLDDPSAALGQVAVDAPAPDPSGAVAHALLSWEETTLGASLDGDVLAQLVQPYLDGPILDLGGGCGGGGLASVRGVASGNPAAVFELIGADPTASVALLNIVPSPGPTLTCGPCVGLLPGSTFSTDLAVGFASLTLPVPCNPAAIGAKLDAQWIVLPTVTSPCPSFANLAVSNRLEVTIGS